MKPNWKNNAYRAVASLAHGSYTSSAEEAYERTAGLRTPTLRRALDADDERQRLAAIELTDTMRAAADEIDRLTAERDEARAVAGRLRVALKSAAFATPDGCSNGCAAAVKAYARACMADPMLGVPNP